MDQMPKVLRDKNAQSKIDPKIRTLDPWFVDDSYRLYGVYQLTPHDRHSKIISGSQHRNLNLKGGDM